jgi:hypothetical protein
MRGRTGNRLCEAGKARGILRVVISEDVGNPLPKRWCALFPPPLYSSSAQNGTVIEA